MKIDTFDLDLFSSRSYSETREQEVIQEVKFRDLVDQNMDRKQIRQMPVQTSVEKEVAQDGQWYKPVLHGGQPALSLTERFVGEMEKMRQVLDAVMDRFSNKNVLENSSGGSFQLSRITQLNASNFSRYFDEFSAPQPRVAAYEFSETVRSSYFESEQTRFSAGGIVKTTDGSEINFSFEMQMDRSFFREDSFSRTETGYALIDPLIVNAGVTAPQLSGVGFSFDLDLDGNSENILAPAFGTGFLSLDKNKDGLINDGGELFGPSTGNGFGELADYDLDNNFWIDENDPIFDELTLYGLDENDEMQLTRIKDAGIGAIYLQGVDTAFDLKDDDNELQARIKKSSIALNEDGSVSSVQEMDWTV
ncbi:MAG: hypothetical protein GY710_09695 [Desulfobacteraceae bacterium]|nr:hypothetical protein [Desulfobacteraceae bacterium]